MMARIIVLVVLLGVVPDVSAQAQPAGKPDTPQSAKQALPPAMDLQRPIKRVPARSSAASRRGVAITTGNVNIRIDESGQVISTVP